MGDEAAGRSRETERSAVDRRRPRRASTPAPAGSDPSPEDPTLEPRSASENDDRLRQDRPPHWA